MRPVSRLPPPSKLSRSRPLFDPEIVRRATKDSFVKLNPTLAKNPVMFVVEVGAVSPPSSSSATSSRTVPKSPSRSKSPSGFGLLSYSPTSPKPWPKPAVKRKPIRSAKPKPIPWPRRIRRQGPESNIVAASKLRAGDIVIAECGDLIPGDGEVIEGIATVDESVITGESAPVIRESGGDRSAVTGGTKILSDSVKIRITSNPGETFLDKMIALVEGAERQKTPNEIALNILIAGLTLIFLLAVATLHPFALYAVASSASAAYPPSPSWFPYWSASSPPLSAVYSPPSASLAWTASCNTTFLP